MMHWENLSNKYGVDSKLLHEWTLGNILQNPRKNKTKQMLLYEKAVAF